MGLVTWFMSHLAVPVTIEISSDSFTFCTRRRTLQLDTCVDVDVSGSTARIAAVGDRRRVVNGNTRVELFTCDPLAIAAVTRADCLVAFLRHGVHELLQRSLVVKFPVIVKGVDVLDDALHGYQAPVLRETLLQAGARPDEIRFERRAV